MSNLHDVVTEEDVEELFGNIGTLKSARLLCEGMAEVVFADEEAAHRYKCLI